MTSLDTISESILDTPKKTLDTTIWNIENNPPTLQPNVFNKIKNIVDWVVERHNIPNLSVFIIGSSTSNQYTENADIDIDFCSDFMNDKSEDEIKDFGWEMKSDFIDNYKDEQKIGEHPIEIFFQPNPFQCMMSVGCYNFLEQKWEVGPDYADIDYDPMSDVYSQTQKQIDKIISDIRNQVLASYETSLVYEKSNDEKFKKELFIKLSAQLNDAGELYKKIKKARSAFKKDPVSKEDALKKRSDKRWQTTDSAFKLLDKFGYVSILKEYLNLSDALKEKSIDISSIAQSVIDIVQKHLDANKMLTDDEHEYFLKANETECNESVSDLIKITTVAGLMAVGSFMPASTLAKELTFAKQVAAENGSTFTINSQEAKQAMYNASNDEMIGAMHKSNVVNAVAQVLWKEARGKEEGMVGRKAVASVILNRCDNNPLYIIDVLKEKEQFSCLNDYKGGWTDPTYQYFMPSNAIINNVSNQQIWKNCEDIALLLVEGKFKSTIGNRNSYLNKKTASSWAKSTWGKKCTLRIGNHWFGYLSEHDPKYVKPGTMISWKKIRQQQNKNNFNTIDIAQNNTIRKPIYVKVKSGDNLSKIAKANKTTVDKILALNKTRIKNKDRIRVGQIIRVA